MCKCVVSVRSCASALCVYDHVLFFPKRMHVHVHDMCVCIIICVYIHDTHTHAFTHTHTFSHPPTPPQLNDDEPLPSLGVGLEPEELQRVVQELRTKRAEFGTLKAYVGGVFYVCLGGWGGGSVCVCKPHPHILHTFNPHILNTHPHPPHTHPTPSAPTHTHILNTFSPHSKLRAVVQRKDRDTEAMVQVQKQLRRHMSDLQVEGELLANRLGINWDGILPARAKQVGGGEGEACVWCVGGEGEARVCVCGVKLVCTCMDIVYMYGYSVS